MSMKTCSACKRTLPESEFTRDKGRKDGLNPYCQQCTRARSRAYDQANPDKARGRSAKYYQANKGKVRERAGLWLKRNPGKAAEYCAKWRKENSGKSVEAYRKWYRANREAALLADKQAREANLEKFLIRERTSYAKRAKRRSETGKAWRKNNRDRVAFHAAARRSALAKRTPPWLSAEDVERMLAFFATARKLTEETATPHHVDHVVPLRGKTVSGLNVPWNLQVLPELDNLKKSNRYAA